jgi:hypothetical protein
LITNSKAKPQLPPIEQMKRKISNDDVQSVNTRKNSSIAEDYQKDHYNIDYPDMELSQKI